MRVTVRREDSDGKTRDKNRDEDRSLLSLFPCLHSSFRFFSCLSRGSVLPAPLRSLSPVHSLPLHLRSAYDREPKVNGVKEREVKWTGDRHRQTDTE